MVKTRFTTVLTDVLFLGILSGLSYFLISFYADAEYLHTGYLDWLVQAFRVKLLEQEGLTSWSHSWSNGLSIWRSYQFIPHYITLGVSSILDVSITRAMILLTIAQFILFRVVLYASFRLLNFSSLTAFICSFISLGIAQYWEGVAEYSLLFGMTFFPVMLVLWTRFVDGKFRFVFPYLLGLSFYLHILLGLYALLLFLFGFLFLGYKTRQHIRLFLLQLFILLATSSLFWFPLIAKYGNEYASSLFSSKEFVTIFLSGFEYLGVGLAIITGFLLSSVNLLRKGKVIHPWVKTLFVYTAFLLVLLYLTQNFSLPHFINQLQLPRGATFVGISALFVIAPLVEIFIKRRNSLFRLLGAILLCFVTAESLWYISIYSPEPKSKISLTDPVTLYAGKDPNFDPAYERIWTPTIDSSTYLAPEDTRFANSYAIPSSFKQVPLRMVTILDYDGFQGTIPQINIERIKSYLKVTGTGYIFFDESSPYVAAFRSDKKDGLADLGSVQTGTEAYHVFRVPWEIRNAVLVDDSFKSSINAFPYDLEVNNTDEQLTFDRMIKEFSTAIYSPKNALLSVGYPSQDTLTISLPKNTSSDLVYINETYDKGWRAFFNSEERDIQPAGPGYMQIDLKDTDKGGMLILKHSWPVSTYVSAFLIALIPLEIAVINGIGFFYKRRRQIV